MSIQRVPRRGPAIIETLVVALFAAVVTAVVLHQVFRRQMAEVVETNAYYTGDAVLERQALEAKYGPARHSRSIEEWIIRDVFQDRRNGVFVDVGANDYVQNSNTYFLEKDRGWSGIAIDALPEFADGYRQHRPQTRFLAAFVSDVGGQSVQFFVPRTNKEVASASEAFTADQGERGEARQVPTTTLNEVLGQAGVGRVDFLSMDIELSEPKALAGFDIERFHPALVCIEAHPLVRQQILDYFARHRYVVLAKYMRTDTQNLYFTPLNP
jgi:FkbM family methyltransferase